MKRSELVNQEPSTVVGKERCHYEECGRLNPIAGPGGNPEATCPLIFFRRVVLAIAKPHSNAVKGHSENVGD